EPGSLAQHDSDQPLWIRARREPLHFAIDRQRQHIFFSQRECAQNDDRERNNPTRQQRPHEDPALGKKSSDSLEGVKHLNRNHRLLNVVNEISVSKPSGGNALATSSGIGGNLESRMDWRQTLAKASLESLVSTLRFFTRPFRSTTKLTRVVPSFTSSAFSSM